MNEIDARHKTKNRKNAAVNRKQWKTNATVASPTTIMQQNKKHTTNDAHEFIFFFASLTNLNVNS